MKNSHIEWSSSYELGIEDIDFQHHFFLNLINRLADEMRTAEHLKYRTALIAELNAYARFHFISEENMMTKAGYPGLENHKKHHRELIDQLSSKGNRLVKFQSDKEAGEIIEFLLNWFIQHTMHEDRLFADYYHQQNN